MARVLIVDDEELARYTMREILEAAGHRVNEAGNAGEALLRFAEQAFDLALIDIIMPGEDGASLIARLRREGHRLPIIAISGGSRLSGMDFLELAKSYGADEILPKPFDAGELLDIVGRVLPGDDAP